MKNIRIYLTNQVEKLGIDIQLQRKATSQFVREMNPEVVIIATGASPITREIPGDKKIDLVNAHDILSGRMRAGDRVVIMGGGALGLRVAELLAKEGKEVTVVEESKRVGSGVTLFDIGGLLRRLAEYNVKILTKAKIEKTGEAKMVIEKEGKKEEITADTIVFSEGLKSNKQLFEELQDEFHAIYLIGDADPDSSQDILEAIHRGYQVSLEI